MGQFQSWLIECLNNVSKRPRCLFVSPTYSFAIVTDLAGLLKLIFLMVPKWQWQFQQSRAEKMLLAITLDKLGKPHILWARMASHAHD